MLVVGVVACGVGGGGDGCGGMDERGPGRVVDFKRARTLYKFCKTLL